MIDRVMTATPAARGNGAGAGPSADNGRRRRGARARPLADAADSERLARLARLAAAASLDRAAWRSLAWALLKDARRLRDVGDEALVRQRLAEVCRLRRQADKAGAFAGLCQRRRNRLQTGAADGADV